MSEMKMAGLLDVIRCTASARSVAANFISGTTDRSSLLACSWATFVEVEARPGEGPARHRSR
ncbi:hypothetical protein AB4144_49545, partial [Rhizobiaceae sp. 2RAB30]